MCYDSVHCAALNAPNLAHTSAPPGAGCVPVGWACSQCYGGHGERETAGPIPNPEAKPRSADGTALETGWESRTPPDNHSQKGPPPPGAGPFCMSVSGQGTTRRRPAKDSAAVASAIRRGIVTARVTIDWPTNQEPTSPQACRQDTRSARPPETTRVATTRLHSPVGPQRFMTTPLATPRKAAASTGAAGTS